MEEAPKNIFEKTEDMIEQLESEKVTLIESLDQINKERDELDRRSTEIQSKIREINSHLEDLSAQ